jgi:PIN domain nuclease of toxin-antitoxin system
MKLLLDTCAFLWLSDRTDLLSESAHAALAAAENELHLHQASVWETQIKYSLGKLRLKLPPREFVPLALARHGVTYDRLTDESIWFLDKLPALHRDPFDRLLIAHALLGGMTIVTPDPHIHQYPVPSLW